jgi:predicted deacetylase
MNDPTLCIVIHDVAPPTWTGCKRLLDALAQIGEFPVTLLAVPRYHRALRSSAFECWLRERAAAGDEIALHGYTHLDEEPLHGPVDRLRRRVYTRGEGEFSGIAFDEAMRRLQAGREWLASLGLSPQGFVAPAWLLGAPAWQALRQQQFAYTCTLRRIHLLSETTSISVVCQSQVYSSSTALRRGLSLAWNESLAHLQRSRPLVRLELHPSDEDHDLLRDSWRRLALRQVQGRRVRTLQQLVAELRTEPAPTPP